MEFTATEQKMLWTDDIIDALTTTRYDNVQENVQKEFA